MLTIPPVPYDHCVTVPISHLQPGDGPSKDLVRDWETFGNLSVTSFQALPGIRSGATKTILIILYADWTGD